MSFGDDTLQPESVGEAELCGLRKRVAELERYIEMHRLRSHGNMETTVSDSLHAAMRGLVGVWPDACSKVWVAIEPAFAAMRNHEQQDGAIRALVGADERCVFQVTDPPKRCDSPRDAAVHVDGGCKTAEELSAHYPFPHHTFTPEPTTAAVQRMADLVISDAACERAGSAIATEFSEHGYIPEDTPDRLPYNHRIGAELAVDVIKQARGKGRA